MSAASGRHPRRYKQCQSISAGNTIALFRRALGEGQVPEILETIRQKRQEDRVTARLFREGKADEALARKERGGLLALLPGGYRDAIRAGVDEWERRLSANAGREGYRIGISVPTNADAHAVGEEIRTRQRARGELRGDDYRLQAVDQRGVQYEIMIAVGDTVRLFDRVNAAYAKGSRGDFGENGTTAEIVSIDPEQGVRLWRADGKVGAVRWTSLTDRATGRIRLAYGHVLTIDARQGATLTDHITLLPAGTRGVNSFRIYPADTRNHEDSVLVVSHGAEKEEIRNRCLMGDPWLGEAGDAEWRTAILENMARNLSRQLAKDLASDFLDAAMEVHRGAVGSMQAAWFRSQQAAEAGQVPDLGARFQQTRETASVLELIAAVRKSAIWLAQALHPKGKAGEHNRNIYTGDMERERRAAERTEVEAEFAAALRHARFTLKSTPVMDGTWQRAAVEGDRGLKRSGRYVGYLDGHPAGFIQNFRTGEAASWKSEQPVQEMSAEERQRLAAARATRESERQAAEEKAGKKAYAIWMKGREPRHNAYLERKGVRAHGLRQDRRGNLLVPMKDATGFLRNVQTIRPDGEKLFVKEGHTHGLFAILGEGDIRPGRPLMIAEGFATAATLREVTGLPVVVAFNSGNLMPIAQTMREKHPDAKLVIAGDNDHHLPRRETPLPNVGKEKAEAAAQAVGGLVLLPRFTVLDGGTDFNDLEKKMGRAALRARLADELKKEGIALPERRPAHDPSRPTYEEREQARLRSTQAQPPAEKHARQVRHCELARRQIDQRRHNQEPSL